MTSSRSAAFFGLLMILAAPVTAQVEPNPAKGKILFMQCAACHATTADAPEKVGPSLFGIYGAKVATRPDFTYSKSMAEEAFRWDDAHLAKFLQKPSGLVPGTKMVFGGIADPARRADIIAYLKSLK
ncbi:hypothetical protein B2G71_09815 [Novosphingobium sp. PC22D]|uniref:c-type cytochrome n=1 Tax=Novosphingobium sp. PC22D TaxID=1962403 RepID=UPI000BFAB8A1|nr:cytochrome c family protein [Novosphingobium sp. PC22D]PEQ12602.1 hypothetical protein B2G71_09815 [Novosphingobium sp. PC22D]